MEDYKNEQWWIELQQSLDGFDDSKMSDSDLGRWNGTLIGGRKGGATNAKSGHMKKIQKENAHIGGSIQGKIQGKKNVENKFWEKLTFEQRSNGGKTSGNNRVKDGTLLRASKIGAKVSTENRIKRKIEKYKLIVDLIKKPQFTFTDMREACKEFGILDNRIAGTAKSILREKSLINQIHKGYNQFNPSIYEKVI